MLPQFSLNPRLLVPLLVGGLLVLVLATLGKVPLGYSFRNLLVRWRTTLLTALAFTLVVSLLTVMLAFVNGMNRLTEGSGQPGNVMVLSDGATDELFSTLGYSDTSNLEREVATADKDGQPLPRSAAVEQVRRDGKDVYLSSPEVYIIVNQEIPARDGQPERRRFVQVRGVVDAEIAGRVHGLALRPNGAWLAEGGVQALSGGQEAIQCVMGEGVARVLGRDFNKPQLEVGDVFDLGDRKWVVVGLLDSAGTTFDSEIWARHQIVAPLFRKDHYSSIVLRTADGASARHLADHLTKQYKTAAVQALPETEYYAKLTETNKQFLVAIIFVTVFMALGGVMGVMNTMFAAVSQRIKDIGVLRILGFARWQVLVSFFLEALGLALIGGLIGLGVGYLTDGVNATSTVSSGMGGSPKSVALKLIVDGNTIMAGLLFTFLMGAVGGLIPALSAMRLRPLESLR
jgi:putative ABC transport system permease protein